MKWIRVWLLCITAVLCVAGCGKRTEILEEQPEPLPTEMHSEETEETEEAEEAEIIEESEPESDLAGAEETTEPENTEETTTVETDSKEPELLTFVDVFGASYTMEIDPNVPTAPYQKENYKRDGQRLHYEDERFTSRLGIDVSRHQGEINWQRVQEEGFAFTFLRLGFRGYGSGSLNLDKRFEENLAGAKEAGLDVGVYLYSQAINEKEALEEADFVLEHLAGTELELPIVYDPESVLDDTARTDDLTKAQCTKNAIAFCEAVEAAGYQPMIYANMLWEAYQLDMAQLSRWPFWYADYEELPQTPYRYMFWQYSNEGRVPEIDSPVDLDIQLIERQ